MARKCSQGAQPHCTQGVSTPAMGRCAAQTEKLARTQHQELSHRVKWEQCSLPRRHLSTWPIHCCFGFPRAAVQGV
jgi:hypothetical protein